MWTESRGISTFDFLRIMSSESELLTWKAQGLSADRLSQENAVMIDEGILVPFIVDPNSQALDWLKQTNSSAEIVLQQDPKLVSGWWFGTFVVFPYYIYVYIYIYIDWE